MVWHARMLPRASNASKSRGFHCDHAERAISIREGCGIWERAGWKSFIRWRGHMCARVSSYPRDLGRILLALFIAVACLPQVARAQAVSGTILGTVTDTSGSVVPNAKVTIVNEGT